MSFFSLRHGLAHWPSTKYSRFVPRLGGVSRTGDQCGEPALERSGARDAIMPASSRAPSNVAPQKQPRLDDLVARQHDGRQSWRPVAEQPTIAEFKGAWHRFCQDYSYTKKRARKLCASR